MSRVRQKNTKPEILVRRLLHAAGLRYVLHSPALPGRPDLAFPKYRTALFVHGCFWHGHGCRAGRTPSSNTDYWSPKIAQNRLRDARQSEELKAQGWRVLIVWECETKASDFPNTINALVDAIRGAFSSSG